MGNVCAEIERMEQLGVIAKVEVHTNWCAVVPKPDCTHLCGPDETQREINPDAHAQKLIMWLREKLNVKC